MPYSALNANQLDKEYERILYELEVAHSNWIDGDEVDVQELDAKFQELRLIQKESIRRQRIPGEKKRVREEGVIAKIRSIKGGQRPTAASAPIKSPPKAEKEKVPVFSGLYRDYAVFKRIFDDLVDQDPMLSEEDKERRLLSHVEGKARDLVAPFISQPGGYVLMRQALKTEYETDENVREHLKTEISKLPQLKGKYDARLNDFKDGLVRVNNAAKQSISATDYFHRSLYSLAIGHFDDKTSTLLVRECEDLPAVIEQVKKWLKEKERLESTGKFKSIEENRRTGPPKGHYKSAAVTSQAKCVFCDGPHYTSDCKTPDDPNRRKSLAARSRLCFVCLRPGHRAGSSSCPNKDQRCANAKCQRNHHALLCDQANSSEQTASVYANCAISPLRKVVSAGAALIEAFVDHTPYLKARWGGSDIRILLDSGSDRTLIARHLLSSRDVFRGEPLIMNGIGGTEATDEITRFYLAGDNNPPIGFYGYVMNTLPNVDIIIGRHDIPALLKAEPTGEDMAYFDTVFGKVHYSRREVKTGVVSAYMRATSVPPSDLDSVLDLDEREVNFELQLHQTATGRYCASLPFLPGAKPPNNFLHAKHRLDRLQRRLAKTPGLTECYAKRLEELVANEHAELLVSEEKPWSKRAFYLPHREVIKEDRETTKFRVVFDASAGKASLNVHLYKGNADTLNVQDCLLRFRANKVAAVSDIRQAFLQIEIEPEDCDYLRFLWQTGDHLKIYRMKRLPFGLVSSPAILMEALKRQLCKYSDKFPETVALLRDSFYMDDLITSVETSAAASRLKEEATEIFADAHFKLHKWNTNDRDLRREWNCDSSGTVCKVLGVNWHTERDEISLKYQVSDDLEKMSPRWMMSLIGTVYDPLGMVEPVKLRLKEILREAILLKIGWDESVPEVAANEFSDAIKGLLSLTSIGIPRHIPPPVHLSLFCDASDRGYGFVVYATDANQCNTFVYGKSRLAPLKKRTTPELELAALTEAVEHIPNLRMHFSSSELDVIVWSDSSITLGRLDNDVNKYGTYVGNRLVRIHRICEKYPTRFRYIPTKLNPGDTYSRPKGVKEFAKLKLHNLKFNIVDLLNQADSMELPRVDLCCTAQVKKSDVITDLPGFERTSDWPRMVRCARLKIQLTFLVLKLDRRAEVRDALIYLYRVIQQQCAEELKQVKLPYFKDENGVIRVRTRNSEDRPIWIPRSSRAAILIIRHCHLRACHMRRRATKALLHEGYYIPRENRLIDQVLKTCVVCQRERKQRIVQPTGDLPLFRTRDYGPFECIALDYFGPIQLSTKKKCWVLLVTCSVSRAIHLEVVNNLSASACLEALNTVFNYRGLPRIVVSDNGTNFTAADKSLRLMRQWIQEKKDEILESEIKWYFNPPRAPWWGGWFERMIGTVKRALHKVNNVKNVQQLRYVLTEIMAVVNSRPLLATDSATEPVITPGHYLIGRNFRSIPSGPGRLDSFKALNQIKLARKRFIKFWRSEYLRQLSTHYKNVTKTTIKVGDLVLVPGDDSSDKWTMARIESVDYGPDGIAREVTVLYPDGSAYKSGPQRDPKGRQKKPNQRKVLMRAVQNLVKLELDSSEAAAPRECDDKVVSCGSPPCDHDEETRAGSSRAA